MGGPGEGTTEKRVSDTLKRVSDTMWRDVGIPATRPLFPEHGLKLGSVSPAAK